MIRTRRTLTGWLGAALLLAVLAPPVQAAPVMQVTLPAPTNVVATATPRQVFLRWDDDPNAFAYAVERRLASETAWFDPGLPGLQGSSTFDGSVVPQTSYVYRVRAIAGDVVSPWAEVAITTPAEPLPFGAQPARIPGRIVAVDFDNGGEGVAYKDNDARNNGGAYRPSEGVDIQRANDPASPLTNPFNVGWIRNGEWLGYTVDIERFGFYKVTLRVASPVGGRGYFALGNDRVTPSFTIPNTGGFQNWQNITISNFTLPTGQRQFLRFVSESDRFNVQYFEFTFDRAG